MLFEATPLDSRTSILHVMASILEEISLGYCLGSSVRDRFEITIDVIQILRYMYYPIKDCSRHIDLVF